MAGFRLRRLSAEAVLTAWAGYQKVRVRLAEIDVRNALRIALEIGLYAYDGYVLETARAERLPLVTLDGGVRRAADRLGLTWTSHSQIGNFRPLRAWLPCGDRPLTCVRGSDSLRGSSARDAQEFNLQGLKCVEIEK